MYFWIGLTDLRKEGVWKLESNGATANYQNWDESYKDNPEPNNHGGNEDCAHLRVGPCSRWRDGWAERLIVGGEAHRDPAAQRPESGIPGACGSSWWL